MKQRLTSFWWLPLTLGFVGCAVGSKADLEDLRNDLDATQTPEEAGRENEAVARSADAASSDARTPTSEASTPDAGATVGDGVFDSGADADDVSCAFAGKLVTFDLTKMTGTQASLAAASRAPGATVTPLARAGVDAVSGSGAMNASNWPTGAVDPNKHFVFSITPPAGCSMTLTSLAIDLKRSSTGPSKAAVGTSADTYATLQNVTVTTTGGSVDVPLPGVTGVSDAVEVHVHGVEASSSSGTLRIQNTLALTGVFGSL